MLQKHLLVAASIAVMWIAVLVVGITDSEFRNENAAGEVQEIPVVSAVAACATIATVIVAWRGFRD